MIVVAGEALIDVVIDASGSVTALPGGAPFNVARMTARLGASCQFVGRLSDDAFGNQLRAELAREGVEIVVAETTPAPTTLALAQLDSAGSADYRFYLKATAAAELRPGDIPPGLLDATDLIALGGLGILIEPAASTILELIRSAHPEVTVLLDPNARPHAIEDPARYRATVAAFLERVDIAKVSVEDLKLLYPGADPQDAARNLLSLGPAAALVTDGPAPVIVHAANSARSMPVPTVEVVDTIGAGDAFLAGFLAWWSSNSMSRADVVDTDALLRATEAAIRVAAAACTVRGANLPEGFDWTAGGPADRIELTGGLG